jgi:hypothetical protein
MVVFHLQLLFIVDYNCTRLAASYVNIRSSVVLGLLALLVIVIFVLEQVQSNSSVNSISGSVNNSDICTSSLLHMFKYKVVSFAGVLNSSA